MYFYKATIVKVVDGDTLDLVVDLGFNITLRERMRIAGVSAPERRTEAGAAATAFLTALLPPGLVVTVETAKAPSREKYGRWIADPKIAGGWVSGALIAAGHAVEWDGKGKRP